MKASQFALVRPASLDAARAALRGTGAMAIAGGQSLLVLLRLRLTAAETLVDLGALPGLDTTRETPASIIFGAATTHSQIEDGALPDPSLGLMPHVAANIAYRAVRNFGTIGGSLALADPAADWPLCLLALDATLHLASGLAMPINEFLDTAFTTHLPPGDLITAIEVPRLPPGSRWGHRKLARKHGAFADSLAAAVWPTGSTPRIALGATSRRPHLLGRTMAALAANPDTADLSKPLAADIADADPDADDYKARCHLATLQRAIAQMRGR